MEEIVKSKGQLGQGGQNTDFVDRKEKAYIEREGEATKLPSFAAESLQDLHFSLSSDRRQLRLEREGASGEKREGGGEGGLDLKTLSYLFYTSLIHLFLNWAFEGRKKLSCHHDLVEQQQRFPGNISPNHFLNLHF